MATAITIQDIIAAIDAEPSMLDELRARLLTRELMELPERLAEFEAATERRFEAIDRRFEAVERRLAALEATLERFIETTSRRFEDVDRQFVDLRTQVGRLNGWMAATTALEEAPLIIYEMGYRYRRLLSRVDLIDMVRDGDVSGIDRGDLDSFMRADAVIEATDQEGRSIWVALEISFTAHRRDSDRAIRNAEFLTRFTGERALAAVASVLLSEEVQRVFDNEEASWYRIPISTLEPE